MKKLKPDAKAKADEYKAKVKGEFPAAPADDPTDVIESSNDIVGQRIEEAMRQGMFDNLRGHGKPLDLRRNPFVPEEKEMAFHLLENSGFSPSWITDRTSMLRYIEQWRAALHKQGAHYQALSQTTTTDQSRQQLQEHWDLQLSNWATELQNLNRRIETLNLTQPIARLEVFKLILDEELKRAGMKRVL
ncbi:MAG: DUF1992 domain-containing protein [Chloroflexi bacterium]|nr:DUF1992 domain-containing protein [Chloroflexota bacterium]